MRGLPARFDGWIPDRGGYPRPDPMRPRGPFVRSVRGLGPRSTARVASSASASSRSRCCCRIQTAAQVVAADLEPDRPIVVTVIDAPPFAMSDASGVHTGLAVDLFRLAAEAAGLDYRLDAAPAGADAGSLVASGGIVLPVEAEATLAARADLSLPFYTATLGVAEPRRSAILGVIEGLATWAFLRVILGVALVLLIVGAAIWLIERRRNGDMFDPSPARGLGAGFWWAGVTLTTIGYGDKAPVTFAGRALAMLWMLTGLAVSASLTATVVTLAGTGGGPVDLPEALRDARVAVVEDSLAGAFVHGRDLNVTRVTDAAAALDAVEGDEADLALGAAPALRHAREQGGARLTIRRTDWDPVMIAMAFAPGDPLRDGWTGRCSRCCRRRRAKRS